LIGSNLSKKLLDSNRYPVICIDNFEAFYPRKLKEENIMPLFKNATYRFIKGDKRSSADLNKIPNVDAILRFAAKNGVRHSIQDPLLYQNVNIAGTQNVLEFADRKVKQFIFASSSSICGLNPNIPWNEIEKLLPISHYACSKLSEEMLGHVYSHLDGIRFFALRFFTVYDPGQRPDLAIHKFFELITQGRPIPVFGNGETIRDCTFIDDVLRGIEVATEYNASNCKIINLGCRTPVSLNALMYWIKETCGKKAIIDRSPEQPGDVTATFCRISKAQRLLGYTPRINLASGLSVFYEWFKKKGVI